MEDRLEAATQSNRRRIDKGLLWRAALVQALAVAALAVGLFALWCATPQAHAAPARDQ